MTSSLTMACTSDFSGLVRGKGFATSDLDKKVQSGIGWTPTNVQITCFDTIAESPYGALGDLVLRPDLDTRVGFALPGARGVSFLLGDIETLDGAPWECCTRSILKAALDDLKAACGLELRATFEHEFMLSAGRGTRAFTLGGFLERLPFAEALFDALHASGIHPDSFLREYGPDQMEITLPPAPALRAADQATILREVTRSVAAAMDLRATFTPLYAPDVVGNGVHMHLSLWTEDGQPATYDPDRPNGLSEVAASCVAGILRHMNAICALTAPSLLSYHRLVPHRWSAAFNNLGAQDREAGVRICPVSAQTDDARAKQFNVEYRAADAAASPYLALAALVSAAAIGVRDGLKAPEATAEDLSLLSETDLEKRGLKKLPGDLEAALAAFDADSKLRACFPGQMPEVYRAHKLGEIAHVSSMDPDAHYTAYASTY